MKILIYILRDDGTEVVRKVDLTPGKNEYGIVDVNGTDRAALKKLAEKPVKVKEK